ncbi:MAG: YhbY family RNA-binding protein [Candidatus Thorarchaeota archaeon]|nr:YhbY family RNA-binding protein [Candidatus Thorarchaeota archaeon]
MDSRTQPDPIRLSIAWQEPAMMQIGKGGLSEGVIREAKRLVNKHRYIKIRLLSSALEGQTKEDSFKSICSQIGATLAGIRGNTAVIYKSKSRRPPVRE